MTNLRVSTLLFLFFALSTLVFSYLHGQLPESFSQQLLSHSVSQPLGMVFDERGHGYVYSKLGMVYPMDRDGNIAAEPVLDISEEVLVRGDHGLGSIALSPNFLVDGSIYLYYPVDKHHLLYYGTDDYDPSATITDEATIGRVTRYTLDESTGFTTVVPDSREVLLGATASDGIPILMISHGTGTIAFGEDGSMLLSAGDAASFESKDVGSAPETWYQSALDDGILTDDQNIGAWRSQYLDSPNGKILRIDPFTGDGLPGNKWYDAASPGTWRSKIYALGFRNPFRLFVIPGTGDHNVEMGNPGVIVAGDVGSFQFEEFNVIKEPGANCGWPIFEGQGYGAFLRGFDTLNTAYENPLYDGDICDQQYFHYMDLIDFTYQSGPPRFTNPCDRSVEIDSLYTYIHHSPAFNYANLNWNPPAKTIVPGWDYAGRWAGVSITDPECTVDGYPMAGYSCLPGFVYTGELYPDEYQNNIFICDYAGWIIRVELDDDFVVTAIDSFHTDARDPSSVSFNPVSEAMYYTSPFSDTIMKISYGGDVPPVAVLTPAESFGPSGLQIDFDASGSYHPFDKPLEYFWDFGDGQRDTGVIVSHTFTSSSSAPISYTVLLTVIDSSGLENEAQAIVSINNSPPEVHIVAPLDGSTYSNDQENYFHLEAVISDNETDNEDLIVEWTTFFHHNTHFHKDPSVTDVSPVVQPSFTAGCQLETFWYRYEVKVTDPQGLSSTDVVRIYPQCETYLTDLILAVDNFGSMNSLRWTHSDPADRVEYYEIWRMTDNSSWDMLERLTAADMSYTDIDLAPSVTDLTQYSYFIKAISTNGLVSYSNVVDIRRMQVAELIVFPNPTSTIIDFLFQQDLDPEWTFSLYNTAGKQIQLQGTDLQVASDKLRVSTEELIPGVYYYNINSGSENYRGKFIRL